MVKYGKTGIKVHNFRRGGGDYIVVFAKKCPLTVGMLRAGFITLFNRAPSLCNFYLPQRMELWTCGSPRGSVWLQEFRDGRYAVKIDQALTSLIEIVEIWRTKDAP